MEISLGKAYTYSRTFTEYDVRNYANLSADDNVVHLDAELATETIFGQRVVHGIFVAGMFSKIFGTIYPGTGAIYLEQNLKFLRPVFFNDVTTARVTLTEFNTEKRHGTFTTECFNSRNEKVLTGSAKILFPADAS